MNESILSLDSLCLAERDSPYETELEDEWDIDHKERKTTGKDISTAEVYLQACKLVGVVPVSYFLRNLGSATINLNHHGLGPLGGKALAIALVTDLHTTTLELADNYLLAEGTRYLVQMLKANFIIQNLDLSDNHLRSAGAEYITKLLMDNNTIKSIKLSGSGFTEDDAKGFADAFSINHNVKELDLSHNQLCGRAGECLGQMLANNEGVEILNLSWNHLRMKGAVAFCAGLKVNVTLKHLDLSWNGFGNEGALALGEALKFNNTLVYLDLSNNRINNEGVGMLCRGLEANDTLRTLKLAYNSLTVEGALVLISVVKNSPKTALEEINICNVLVNEFFVQLLELICQDHPGLEVQYGGVGGFIAKKPPKRPDPMKVIQDYLDQRKLRLWDFFRNIDKDGTMRVPVTEFRKAVQAPRPIARLYHASSPPMPIPTLTEENEADPRPLRHVRSMPCHQLASRPIVVYEAAQPSRQAELKFDTMYSRSQLWFQCVFTAAPPERPNQSSIPLDKFQIEQLIQKLDRERTGIVDYRGLADTRKQMMRDHRRQLRKVESRQKKEKQKSERILKTFQTAVDAVTPHTSIVMSPGEIKEDSGGPQPFLATPLSSWHHIIMSNSSRYSITNMGSEHFHLPMIGKASPCRPPSSLAMRSYSQPNLMDNHITRPILTKPASAQGMHSTSNPSETASRFCAGADHLTRSRPALNTEQPVEKVSKAKKKKSKSDHKKH